MLDCDSVWHPELIVLEHTPTIIRYDFMPIDADAEVIGAFSRNCRDWDQGGCDALSWYAASHRDDFSFRGKMFGTFPANLAQVRRKVKLGMKNRDRGTKSPSTTLQGSPTRIRAGEWHTMEVALSLSEATYRVDGQEWGKVLRERGAGAEAVYPERGYLGMIRYESTWKYRNLQVMRSEQFFSHLDTRRWQIRWPEVPTTVQVRLRYGRFVVFGIEYQLQDTDPVSFSWPDGTRQSMHTFDGQRITWRTNHPAYPTIFWDVIHDDGLDHGRNAPRVSGLDNNARTMRLMRALLESDVAVEADRRRSRRGRCHIS